MLPSCDESKCENTYRKLDTDDNSDVKKSIKIREYINSAVYVESTYNMNNPCKEAIYMPGSGDHQIKTVKRCVCFTNPKECPFHPLTEAPPEALNFKIGNELPASMPSSPRVLKYKNSKTKTDIVTVAQKPPALNVANLIAQENEEEQLLAVSLNGVKLTCGPTQQSNRFSECDSGITVKANTLNSVSDLRLSIPSLTSLNTVRFVDESLREENFRQWCQRKDTERKLQEERDELIRKIKEQQKQAVVELERENFRRWLMAKRKKDDEVKKKKLREAEDEKLKMEIKEKRMQENELNFQLWLKKKEEIDLEKKIKLQMTLIEQEEQRQKRLEYSRKAYENWKDNSKNRQKPVPFGLGIDTLRSSASVAYINPEPWVPNIKMDKPQSQ